MQVVEIELEYHDPLQTVRKLLDTNLVFFDSAEPPSPLSRFSFIATDPFATMTSKNGRIVFNSDQFYANPFSFLKQQMSHYRMVHNQQLPPFQGGVAGYFGYDLCRHLERLPSVAGDDCQFDDLALGFYDTVIAYDHLLKKCWVISTGLPELNETYRKKRALKRADQLRCVVESKHTTQTKSTPLKIFPVADMSHTEYVQKITKVLNYIKNGDIYQANIAQRFSAVFPDNLCSFDLYLRLRQRKSAPFSAYVNLRNNILLSASPERFLRVSDRIVETRPIKGTRKRGSTIDLDKQLADELLRSEKDRAENIMIVDLLRNDLAKVCELHSVEVSQLCGLESYPTVHHLVSVIRGKLNAQSDNLDLLCASFPGGSITGAPKIRAMEIIAELEAYKRGPYCGSIAYLGFNGEMDSSIIIRTLALKDHKITYHVGGGIVSDSNPDDEYEETLIKGSALYSALTLA